MKPVVKAEMAQMVRQVLDQKPKNNKILRTENES